MGYDVEELRNNNIYIMIWCGMEMHHTLVMCIRQPELIGLSFYVIVDVEPLNEAVFYVK